MIMVSVVGKTPQDRQRMSSSRTTWNQIAPMTFGYIGPAVAVAMIPVVGYANQFAALAFIMSAIMVFGYMVNFWATAGYEEAGGPAVAQNKPKVKTKDLFKSLAQNPHVMCLVVSDIPRTMVAFIINGTARYYWLYVGMNMAMFRQYIFFNGLGALIGAFLAGHLAKKFYGRSIVLVCYAGMIVFLVLTYMNRFNPNAVIVLMACMSFFRGMMTPVGVALYGDAAVFSEWKTGTDARGWIMGLNNIPLKTSKVFSGLFINVALMVAHFDPVAIRADPSQITRQLQNAITFVFTIIPSILFVMSFLLILFGFKLSRKSVAEYQAEINARKAQS